MERNTITTNQTSLAMTEMQLELFQVEAFLSKNYRFRRNILSGKTEMTQTAEEKEAEKAQTVMTEGLVTHHITLQTY